MQLPKIIRDNHCGIERGWTVTGKCQWKKIAGWHCLVDEAGLIHQVHGDVVAHCTIERHETHADNF